MIIKVKRSSRLQERFFPAVLQITNASKLKEALYSCPHSPNSRAARRELSPMAVENRMQRLSTHPILLVIKLNLYRPHRHHLLSQVVLVISD